jgi:pimeloyl-ACP methyl ester carboxylesterase
MTETAFQVPAGDGVLHGHTGGSGPPALLLHGGPAFPDYTEGCADELAGLFTTMRYTQRGAAPTTTGGPYTIEMHMGDALAVLDAFGHERAWAIGHSWGGHLALHLAVAHPDRLLGVICIDPLGAFGEILGEMGENMRRGLSTEQIARLDEIEGLRREGRATAADLVERAAMNWPMFFPDPSQAPPMPPDLHVGVDCSRETNASIAEHFERGTLAEGLPRFRRRALFVHGELDPLPVRTSTETAALIPGASVAMLPRRGHFPWLEVAGEIHDAVAAWV